MASSVWVASPGGNNVAAIDAPSAESRSPPVDVGVVADEVNPPGRKRGSSSGGNHAAVGGAVGGGATDGTSHHQVWGGDGGGTNTTSSIQLQHHNQHQSQQNQAEWPNRSRSNTPNNATVDGATAAKKRRTGPGSRGVANLTPEQLARKRANDREAQRAIRERQRLRTEQYEQEIRELKSKQPYQEMQAVIRQKEAVEAELADVKRCLAAIMAMVQPIVGGGGGVSAVDQQSRSCTSPGQPHPPSRPQPVTIPPNPGSTPTSVTSPASVGTHGRWPNSMSPTIAPGSVVEGQPQAPVEIGLLNQPQVPVEIGVLNQQRYDLAHGLDLGPDRLGLEFLVDPNQRIATIQSGRDGAQDSPQYRHVPMKHDWTASSMVPGSVQNQSPTYTTHPPIPTSIPHPTTTKTNTTSIANLPISSLLPKNSPPTCPLDSLLLDFLAERRQRAAEGLPQTEILGPRYPSVSSLLNPAVSVFSHPLSKVFTDILARFPDISTLPERVAVLYLMFLLMRWQVSPTEENYHRLPPWFRPLRVQTEREHPAWLDHLPFPGMREKIVEEYGPGEFPFEEFFIPFTSTMRVNWPYEDMYVLLASPTGDELMINPVFEQHLGMLEHWTLGDAFDRAFPGLRGTYNLKAGT